ncbi:MAG: AbrB/MazE/SpoVT family DNA-binding domain-containing protein [candidate division Zixibacteria bacterium]|nr:AbrB/MazE/SpoVT family DNA-binding domain-containing protein [candidate division Zixibacteria bacterium]
MKIQSESRRSKMAAVKVGVSRQVVIPKKLYDELGLTPGDYLEVERDGEKLVLTPKTLIEKRLAEGLDDIKKGRVHGPFDTAADAVKFLRKSTKSKRK